MEIYGFGGGEGGGGGQNGEAVRGRMRGRIDDGLVLCYIWNGIS